VRQSAYTATLTLTDGAYTSPQAISLSGISIGAENKLGFPNAPYTVTFGGGLPTVNVQVQDSLGNLVPTAADLITLTLTYPDSTTQTFTRYATSSGTSGGAATGTIGVNLGSVFTFPGLYTLQASREWPHIGVNKFHHRCSQRHLFRGLGESVDHHGRRIDHDHRDGNERGCDRRLVIGEPFSSRVPAWPTCLPTTRSLRTTPVSKLYGSECDLRRAGRPSRSPTRVTPSITGATHVTVNPGAVSGIYPRCSNERYRRGGVHGHGERAG